MTNTVIVTTPDQLRGIIAAEVATILPKLADFRRKNEPVETDALTVEAAARFMTEMGIPSTRASIYNLVYKNAIPHRKFGRRTVFSKKELREWIDERAKRPEKKQTKAATLIAERVDDQI